MSVSHMKKKCIVICYYDDTTNHILVHPSPVFRFYEWWKTGGWFQKCVFQFWQHDQKFQFMMTDIPDGVLPNSPQFFTIRLQSYNANVQICNRICSQNLVWLCEQTVSKKKHNTVQNICAPSGRWNVMDFLFDLCVVWVQNCDVRMYEVMYDSVTMYRVDTSMVPSAMCIVISAIMNKT